MAETFFHRKKSWQAYQGEMRVSHSKKLAIEESCLSSMNSLNHQDLRWMS